MAIDLGLRGAAKRLREGTWYETARQVERAADEIDRLTEQRDVLLAALERHGEHLVSCAYSALRGTSCTCGLDAAIAKAGGGNG